MRKLRYKKRDFIIVGNRRFSLFQTGNLLKRLDNNGDVVFQFGQEFINSVFNSGLFCIYVYSSKEEKRIRKILTSLGIRSEGRCLKSCNEELSFNPLTLVDKPKLHFARNYKIYLTDYIELSQILDVFKKFREFGFKTEYLTSRSFEVIL